MANTKLIKQKIKAITSIKKITKTMEMVAVSKMKKSVNVVSNMREYFEELKSILQNIVGEADLKHPFISEAKENGVELIIIFASNKGLAGSFNSNLYKVTKKIVETNSNIKKAITFGKFADKIARKLNLEVELSFTEIEKVEKVNQIFKIEKFFRDNFLEGKLSKVHAIYTSFIKSGIYEVKNISLYPLGGNIFQSKEKSLEKKQIYTFEPSADKIISRVIPKIVRSLLLSFILESRASENSSRSFAMKRASESAGEILGDLKIKYNKVRQDGITAEIAEISAGSNS